MTIKNRTPYELTTINTGLKDIRFYIEGIASDGTLISEVIKLEEGQKN